MGGFVGGMIAGAVVVLLLGAALSLNTPLTRKPEVVEKAPEPAEIEAAQVTEAEVGTIADADVLTLPAPDPAPADAPDTVAGLSEVENAPNTVPEVNETAVQVDSAEQVETTDVAIATEAPVAPQAPTSPQVPEALAEAPLAEDVPAVIEEAPTPPAPVEEVVVEEVAPAEDIPVSEPLPEVAAVEPEPETQDPVAVEPKDEEPTRTLPRIAAVPQIGADQATEGTQGVGRRVVPLTERDGGEPVEETANAAPVSDKPIEAYAAEFDQPGSVPLMSIILIDDEGAYGAEALQDFPYPISFAISPSDPEAAEKMARYRAAGFEVLAMADLPKEASAQDAEVSLSVWLDMLPETVGILEGVDTGIQGNRKLADQVAAIAGGTGRGLITQDNGLNTVQKLAARNGIPSSVIFRDIDGARQEPKVMRRFLDQAAFRAGQEGSVVMLGRLRPDTISALLVWGLEDRGGRVTMAPISAVMKRQVQ